MQVDVEHVAPDAGRSWLLTSRCEDQFGLWLHRHDFLELTYIVRGRGRRLVGDTVRGYAPGDLVLIGPGVAHAYFGDPRDGPHEAWIAQFPAALLPRALLAQPEFAALDRLCADASAGVEVGGGHDRWSAQLHALASLRGADQTLALFGVLQAAATCGERRAIASTTQERRTSVSSDTALSAIVRYLETHFREEVHRNDVAAAAGLTPSSASRLMHSRLGTSITDYLVTLRIGAAARLLTETSRSVTSIAVDCGYANLANFHRQFRRRNAMSPSAYRRHFSG